MNRQQKESERERKRLQRLERKSSHQATGLEPGDTGTVKRRQKTVVTQKMAMESFRYSFLSVDKTIQYDIPLESSQRDNSKENQDLSFDAILGELSELETQLGTAHTEMSAYDHCLSPRFLKDENRDSGNDLAMTELDALASEITHSLGFKHKRPMGELDYFHTHYPGDLGGYSDAMLDIAETDSAFSESASLPSSESFTSMVTVSSSAEAAGMGDMSSISSGSTIMPQSLHCDSICPCMRFANTNHTNLGVASDPWSDPLHHHHHHYQANHHHHNNHHYHHPHHHHQQQQIQQLQQLQIQQHEEQKARIQAEKIRIALEKIKEAKIKKLFVRAFASDGSSKSILVDEKMTIVDVISLLSDKNHVRLHSDLAVIEHMPELFMERVLEDHDSLVENMVMWTRDTKNKILFENRVLKNDLFKTPERYLLMSSSSEKGASLDPKRRENLIQEFFSGGVIQVPEVEGVLYLKSDGKKAWKKYYFVLRASGLYYNPKGKISKSSKDLSCLVQFEYVELYDGLGWKKKYHAPTDYCFALKHPQIQKKTSKFIRYLCAENKAALDQWIMGIRIAKYGKQLLINFQNLQREILLWDSRDIRVSLSDQADAVEALAELNQGGDLRDSRFSMPEPGSRHSFVNIKTCTDSKTCEETVCFEDKLSDRVVERKSSLTNAPLPQTPQETLLRCEKAPVKRVSFSTTHSVIHDCGEEVVAVRHRDSITSASTDSSEDSTSSGEGRMSNISHRGGSKLRAKLPVTTGTTRQISEMVQTSLDGHYGSLEGSMEEWRPTDSSPVQKDVTERRKSAPVGSDIYGDKRCEGPPQYNRTLSQTVQYDHLPMSPTSQYSPHPGKGQKSIMSPQPQKGIKTHSRGSSLSSLSSSDSNQSQGYVMSPTSPTPSYQLLDQNQSPWSFYESIDSVKAKAQGVQIMQGHKQPPPTAQKPTGIKKVRPQSGPAAGPVEKGHRRNTSKSSLESVEEGSEGLHSPVGISSPTPIRASLTGSVTNTDGHPPPPAPKPPSQPNTPTMSMSAPNFSTNQNHQMYGGPVSPHIMHHSSHIPIPIPSSQPSPQSQIGCMSPRLSAHRSSIPKPIGAHGMPCPPPTPPPMVHPVHRNSSSASDKTHKKRPSGGNIVVNGNQGMSGYPDSPRSSNSSEYPGTPPNTSATTRPGHNRSSSEDSNYAPLPFMAELSKHMHKAPQSGSNSPDTRCPPEVLPKPSGHSAKVNGNNSANNNINNNCSDPSVQTTVTSHSHIPVPVGADNSGKFLKKAPPPPKRSDKTKLSTTRSNSSDLSNVPNESTQSVEPIYNDCEGILDINDLPLPPPELLEGFTNQEEGAVDGQGHGAGRVKPPAPPPPPKRSKDTHLSSSTS